MGDQNGGNIGEHRCKEILAPPSCFLHDFRIRDLIDRIVIHLFLPLHLHRKWIRLNKAPAVRTGRQRTVFWSKNTENDLLPTNFFS